MTKIKFGTDGWRALMGKEYTLKNVQRVAQAFAEYIKQNHKNGDQARVAVGYDYRDQSDVFANEFCGVLTANNISVTLSNQPLPTPAVSRAVIESKSDAGIVITASHNPGGYNGVKIKDRTGASADVSITRMVEELIDTQPVKRQDVELEPLKQDFLSLYLDKLRAYIDMNCFKNKPFRVLVDSMHGVGAYHIQELLKGSSVSVKTLRGERDVKFGGVAPEPIPKNFPSAITEMKSGNFDLGVVTDGDADRIGGIRPGGAFVSPGTLLSLIMLHLAEDMGKRGSVITTVSNTSLIYRVARKLGLKVHETPVGFKYICEIMRKENVLIAGEESGGLAFQNYMLERDGILSAMLLIQMMEHRGQTFEQILSEVESTFGKFHYVRTDMQYPDEKKPKLLKQLKEAQIQTVGQSKVQGKNLKDGVKFLFENDAWLLFRLSGTEPLLRIYGESTNEAEARALVAWGEQTAHAIQ